MIKKVPILQLQTRLDQIQAHFPQCLLIGNDDFLIEQSIAAIKKTFQALHRGQALESIEFEINAQTQWNLIVDAFCDTELFSTLKLVRFNLPNAISAAITAKLETLLPYFHSEIALIFVVEKSSVSIGKNAFLNALPELWAIYCTALDRTKQQQWLMQKLIQQQLQLESAACERLLYYYEGNLYALDQLIAQIALLFPQKAPLSLAQIESLLEDVALFTPFHWIDAILSHQSKRALHILHQLEKEAVEPLMLVRIYQKALLMWIDLKKAAPKTDWQTLFNQYHVWQNQRPLLLKHLTLCPLTRFYDCLFELSDLEMTLKTNQTDLIWPALSRLTLHSIVKA